MDKNSLNRFLSAQEKVYEKALSEIKGGKKRSHWMWFIFPQLRGLGFSENSVFYGISGLAEAKEYLRHPVLGLRLKECCEALLMLENRTAEDIFDCIDDMKLLSCLTLFEVADEGSSVFGETRKKYFNNQKDEVTLTILEKENLV